MQKCTVLKTNLKGDIPERYNQILTRRQYVAASTIDNISRKTISNICSLDANAIESQMQEKMPWILFYFCHRTPKDIGNI